MTSRLLPSSAPSARWGRLAVLLVGLAGVGLVLVLLAVSPSRFGLLLGAACVAALAVTLGLRDPVLAFVYLLVATFFRLAIPSGTLPVDPFLIAFGGVLASTAVRMAPRLRDLPTTRIDPLSCGIFLYLSWNALSAALRHPQPAGAPLDPNPFSLSRYIVIGIAMPLVMFLVGSWVCGSRRALRVLLWSVVGAAAYSALISVLQFAAPALVWPRYVVTNTAWPGRAVGVFNQPVVNGMVLIVGFLVAVLLASHQAERHVLRIFAAAVALGSVSGIYLTHTRVVWLALGLVVVLGAVLGRGFRRGFVLTLTTMVVLVTVNWSTFTSSDRSAGGIGSPNEVQDRLNTLATSFWAFQQKPITGWGIGRFTAVNTYHHQQFSAEIPWQRGFGIPSHFDALGILVELGLVGLACWIVVLVLIYSRLVRATRLLPAGEMYGRPLAVTALLCLLAQTITGLTVDLRFFDFPNIVVLLLAGAVIAWQREQAGMNTDPEADAQEAVPRQAHVP